MVSEVYPYNGLSGPLSAEIDGLESSSYSSAIPVCFRSTFEKQTPTAFYAGLRPRKMVFQTAMPDSHEPVLSSAVRKLLQVLSQIEW